MPNRFLHGAFRLAFFLNTLLDLEQNMSGNPNEEDAAIQLWKVKKLIKNLESARGNGTSMISLILPVNRKLI